MRNLRLLLYIFSLTAMPSAQAGKGLDYMQSYMSGLKTLQARFTQTQIDDKMRQTDVIASGELFLKKPGKFRWEYKQPYSQLIVSDSKNLWIYDPELEQAVLKPIDQALGATPIALLTGEKPLQEQFKIIELGNFEGREMVQLEPLIKDTDYELILLALTDRGLEVMQLKDRLGNVTSIELLEQKQNAEVDDSRFDFKPPKGVDIVRE